jgi:Tfp pilus assembly protein PilX
MKNTNRTNRCAALQFTRFGRQQGMALVTTLLLLTLLSAVTLGMVLAASSDELINGYYRNMRGSFYAADSGLNIVRQDMLNQLVASVPSTLPNPTVEPISDSAAGGIVSSINSSYGSSNTSLNSGQAAGSWPAGYKITAVNLSEANCTPSGPDVPTGTTVCPPPTGSATHYTYTYSYSLTAEGQTRASEATTLTDRGSFIIDVDVNPSGGETSFAAWGFFVDTFPLCGSLTLVPGTITGPAFSNDGWTFGTSGSYIFTDEVGSHEPNFGYRFSGSQCYQSPNDPYVRPNGQTINPDFQGGFQLGQAAIPLPENDYNQKQAVLDGVGDPPACAGVSTPCPTYADMSSVLRMADSTQPYPPGGASSGVYMPYTTTSSASCMTPPCMTGGGIYVEGNASVTLTASTDTTPDPDHNLQVVTIVQGSTTSTVTIDLTGNTTTFQTGSNTTTISGVPGQYDSTTSALEREAALIYVNGQITSLKGPGSNNPAIQDGSALTVVASNDVIITDDILYKTKPVTTTQNQIPGTPPATLIPESDSGQVLGIYTNGGDIRLQNCSGCGNLEIDASLAALDASGSHTIRNSGSAINTLTIMGGRIQNAMGNINTTTRNVFFDRRYSQGGFAPPWFPSTTVTTSGPSTTDVNLPPSVQRVQWLNRTPF